MNRLGRTTQSPNDKPLDAAHFMVLLGNMLQLLGIIAARLAVLHVNSEDTESALPSNARANDFHGVSCEMQLASDSCSILQGDMSVCRTSSEWGHVRSGS